MEKQGFRGVMLLVIFIWAGMILGISFLEAPLKFQAPHVTLPIGLGIGRLVFGTLNKIEIVFCLSLIILSFIVKPSKWFKYLLVFIAILLAGQTLWLLPALDARAQVIIDGGVPSQSSPHIFYIVTEVLKLFGLIVLGLKLFIEPFKKVKEFATW